jgi:pyridinium-3,5-bisthiocarboxylic acid mononucleotide nickel chelatase
MEKIKMKILYYDCFSGISGDMNLGALVDLGVDSAYLIQELSKLHLESEYEITVQPGQKNGISGTKVNVLLTHEEHHHHDDHEDEHLHHHHRNLNDISAIINGSDLNDRIKASSLKMFQKIAEAESKVHGEPIDKVHFHEVGATDSIVDMVGAAIALDSLNVNKIIASPVQVGGGFVKCAHGIIPVPAPATVEILQGIPIKSGIVPFETTTPTGAAILACNAEEFTEHTDFKITKVGYGLGDRDLEIPNALRVFLGEMQDTEETEEQYLLETNIDDMNPEFFSYVEEKLFIAGALDVFKTPIVMKKGRPATKLSVLANAKTEKDVTEILWKETTSIGLRKFKVDKIMLRREFSKVTTKYGDVTVKTSIYEGKTIKHKAEYEDCRKIADKNGIPLAEVYRAVEATI